MIQLSRVRLINWHNFVDDTLTFERITYLIGVNAIGKTTILDAIRYCLTTNKGSLHWEITRVPEHCRDLYMASSVEKMRTCAVVTRCLTLVMSFTTGILVRSL